MTACFHNPCIKNLSTLLGSSSMMIEGRKGVMGAQKPVLNWISKIFSFNVAGLFLL